MAKKPAAVHADGLHIDRVFSTSGQHPFDSVAWTQRDAAIKNFSGEAIFEQKAVEFPDAFSPLAVNVVASKYFYGDVAKGNGDPAQGQREWSLKQLVHRVTRTITDWGRDQDYFASDQDAETFYDELTWLCTNQYGAFNSPVWFNVGLGAQYGVRDSGGKTISGWDRETGAVADVDPYERPQASACFIISVQDSVDDIWKLMGESARLFKFGSGVGADWSKLRSSHEKLSGGGIPSGPVSFMKVQDATGGTIKSGGKTRRAAIMQTLKVWHPDILEFVTAKQTEERKAWALIEEGYDGSFNGDAYGSVAFQNVNQSVRLNDAFMTAANEGAPFALTAVTSGEAVQEVDAQDLLLKISEGHARLRRPGRAVRGHDPEVAHVQEPRPDQLQQPVLGVHVLGRFGVQPGVLEPDEVQARGRHVRRRALPRRGARLPHGPGDPGRQRRATPRPGSRPTATSTARSGSASPTWARS